MNRKSLAIAVAVLCAIAGAYKAGSSRNPSSAENAATSPAADRSARQLRNLRLQFAECLREKEALDEKFESAKEIITAVVQTDEEIYVFWVSSKDELIVCRDAGHATVIPVERRVVDRLLETCRRALKQDDSIVVRPNPKWRDEEWVLMYETEDRIALIAFAEEGALNEDAVAVAATISGMTKW